MTHLCAQVHFSHTFLIQRKIGFYNYITRFLFSNLTVKMTFVSQNARFLTLNFALIPDSPRDQAAMTYYAIKALKMH